MGAKRIAALVLAIACLAYAYFWLIPQAINIAFRWDRPEWWSSLFATQSSAALTWLQIPHTAALLVAALPVALSVRWISRRHSWQLGLLVSAVVTVWTVAPVLLQSLGNGRSMPYTWIHIFDLSKVFIAVPLLAWLLAKVPSNISLQRDRVR